MVYKPTYIWGGPILYDWFSFFGSGTPQGHVSWRWVAADFPIYFGKSSIFSWSPASWGTWPVTSPIWFTGWQSKITTSTASVTPNKDVLGMSLPLFQDDCRLIIGHRGSSQKSPRLGLNLFGFKLFQQNHRTLPLSASGFHQMVAAWCLSFPAEKIQ